MSNEIRKELGEASSLSMDSCIRTIVAQMFEADNDEAVLEIVLENTSLSEPPRIELQIKLLSINGKSPDDMEQAA